MSVPPRPPRRRPVWLMALGNAAAATAVAVLVAAVMLQILFRLI